MTVLDLPNPHPTTDSFRAVVTLGHPSDRRTTEHALSRVGFSVRAVEAAVSADAVVRTFAPDVVVIDAREVFPAPSRLVTGVRRSPATYLVAVGANDETQRLTAFRHGCDDAVTTDTTADEIAVRCRVMVDRARRHRTLEVEPESRVMTFGPLTVDTARREISIRGHAVPATRLEFDLLARICATPDEVVSRAQLLEAVWGPHWFGDTHVVDVHLSNLRRKLQARCNDRQFWLTVRGVGFRVSDDMFDEKPSPHLRVRSA